MKKEVKMLTAAEARAKNAAVLAEARLEARQAARIEVDTAIRDSRSNEARIHVEEWHPYVIAEIRRELNELGYSVDVSKKNMRIMWDENNG